MIETKNYLFQSSNVVKFKHIELLFIYSGPDDKVILGARLNDEGQFEWWNEVLVADTYVEKKIPLIFVWFTMFPVILFTKKPPDIIFNKCNI